MVDLFNGRTFNFMEFIITTCWYLKLFCILVLEHVRYVKQAGQQVSSCHEIIKRLKFWVKYYASIICHCWQFNTSYMHRNLGGPIVASCVR